jgi:hypothetical protein
MGPRPYDVFVSGRGVANGQAKVPNAGGRFGPDTPGTQTSGIQEALDFLLSAVKKPGVKIPEGGRVLVTGNATINATVKIPVWPGLLFEAEHITVEMPSGDGFLIGYDYVEAGRINVGAMHLNIGILDGPHQGNRTPGQLPAYNPDGVTGLHIRQLDAGRVDIGSLRFFTRYGIFLDGYDATDPHSACIDSLYLVNSITSNGVGLRTKSNSSPQGSFTGGNKMILGHFLGNYFGILIDADIDAKGVITTTTPTTIHNHIFATVEDSISTRANPPPEEACDVYINGTANLFFLNAKITRLRGDKNYLIVPAALALHRYNPSDNNVVHAISLLPAGFTQLPANPPVPGTVYRNLSGHALEIYLPVTFRGPGQFQSSLGAAQDKMVPLPPNILPPGTPPGSTLTFFLRVPSGWFYSFSANQVEFGTAQVVASPE